MYRNNIEVNRNQANMNREEFIEEHSPYVCIEGDYIFHDGAIVKDSGEGQIIPPSDDLWERHKIIYRYYDILTQQTEEAFHDYKNFLDGNGFSDVICYTEDEQLEHLKKLKRKANAARFKLNKAERDIIKNRPDWVCAAHESDARDVDVERKASLRAKAANIRL